MRIRNNRKINSFGLIEVLISGVVLITIISATASVRQRTSSQSSYTRHEEVATMLAQEGIEAIHQIRDSNYLLQMKNLATGAIVKVPWDCYILRHAVQAEGEGSNLNAATYRLNKCENAIWNTTKVSGADVFEVPNRGDFSRTSVSQESSGGNTYLVLPSAELSSNTLASTFPTDNNGTHYRVTNYNISYPSLSDSTNLGMVAPLNSSISTVGADSCIGIERIFVREGSAPLKAHPGGGDRAYISENHRYRTSSPASTGQDNYYDPLAAGAGCGWSGWGGMTEFHRQVAISPTRNASDKPPLDDASISNWPADWNNTNTPDHFARVLVRVSWNEQSRFAAGGMDSAVLLATYLTDWRP